MTRSLPPFLCLFLLAASSVTAAETWVDVGPRTGRQVHDLVLDGEDPSRAYAATGAGVFSRAGASADWRLSHDGLPLIASLTAPPEVLDLSVHPERWNIVYAVTGLCAYVSQDGGIRWRSLCGETSLSADRIDISRADPSVVHLYGSFHLYRSEDGGESWIEVELMEGFVGVADVVFDPDDPRRFLVATQRLDGGARVGELLETTDGGETWRRIPGAPLEEGRARLLQWGAQPGELYLEDATGDLWVSRDGGVSWDSIGEGLPTGESAYLAGVGTDARRPGVVLAALAFGRLAPDDSARRPALFRSLDGGESWQRSDHGLPPDHVASRLVISPDDPDTVFAPGSRGIFRSDDGGLTWERVEPALPAAGGDLRLQPNRPDTLYITGSRPGLFRSDDGGGSWDVLSGAGSGLPDDVGFLDLELDPDLPSTVYLTVLGDENDTGWFRSDDRGDHWTELARFGRGDVLQDLLVLPGTPPTLLAGGISGAYRSTDGGTTWDPLSVGLSLNTLAASPVEPDRFYAGAYVSVLGRGEPPRTGVFRSDDRGQSWSLGDEGLPQHLSVGAIAESPSRPSVLLVGMSFYGLGGPSGRLYRSVDGGATWALWGTGLPGRPITALRFDPIRPQTVFAGTYGEGVYRSFDSGETWHPLGEGLTHPLVSDLAVTPDASTLYVTSQAGVHRLRLEERVSTPPPGPWLESPSLAGFRLKVRIDGGGGGGPPVPGTLEPDCIPETVCVSGALAGRSELFVRVLGPRPNGYLWPTLVRFTPSRVEVWIEQLSTGEVRTYELPASGPGDDELPGLQDRFGFRP